MKPQFIGLLAKASNIVPDNQSVYTVEMFLADFPQFSKIELITRPADADHPEEWQERVITSLVPSSMLEMFIQMANAAILEERWFEKWRYAMGLYIAHYATMFLRSYSESSQSPQDAAISGAVVGNVASATLGDSSVSYDNTAINKATEQWGTWNATQYGQLLVTEARLVGLGGTYAI